MIQHLLAGIKFAFKAVADGDLLVFGNFNTVNQPVDQSGGQLPVLPETIGIPLQSPVLFHLLVQRLQAFFQMGYFLRELAVDNALYSDSINKTIAMMAQGDFLKKTIIKDQNGVVRDVRLEKYRAMLSLNDDIVAVGRLTRRTYRGWPMRKKLVYVNTKDQAPWSDWDVAQLDEQNPVNSADVRLYLGQAATIRPCFNIDLGCMHILS